MLGTSKVMGRNAAILTRSPPPTVLETWFAAGQLPAHGGNILAAANAHHGGLPVPGLTLCRQTCLPMAALPARSEALGRRGHARPWTAASHSHLRLLRVAVLLSIGLLALAVWRSCSTPEASAVPAAPPQAAGLGALDLERAAAVRHAARRAMFGGFTDPEDLGVEPYSGTDAPALAEAARELATGTLAEPPPGNNDDPQSPSSHPGELDLGLDPWLPRLGPVRSAAQALGLRSFYSKWIIADLSVWGEHGITRDMVSLAASQTCHGAKLRFQIIGGRLWVDHLSERGPQGWYPGAFGVDWISGKGRVPLLLLMLFDVLRSFPGQVPDVDVAVGLGDAPCVWYDATKNDPGHSRGTAARVADAVRASIKHFLAPAAEPRAPSPAPPIMTFDTSTEHVDIPLPDFSYYGHEMDRLLDAAGEPVVGWKAQLSFLRRIAAAHPFEDRERQLAWRGRTQGERDFWRYSFVNCPENLTAAGRDSDAELFNLYTPDLRLPDLPSYRYNAYIESGAWSTNFKQKLAAGSPVVAVVPRFPEWFSRALVPGVHYLTAEPAAASQMAFCDGIVDQVKAMEAAAEADGFSGSRGPEHMGRQAARFLREHLRMEDVRQYVLDVLKTYSALQTFQVTPSRGAVPYSHSLLVEQFAFPHQEDADRILAAYPWLAE